MAKVHKSVGSGMVKYGRWCQVSSRFSLLKTLVFPCKNWSFHLRKLKFGTLQIVVFNCQNSFIIEIRQFFLLCQSQPIYELSP